MQNLRKLSRAGLALFTALLILGVYSLAAAAENVNSIYDTETSSNVENQTESHGITSATLTVDYWAGYISDTESIATAPFHWQASDWGKAALVLGIASVFYMKDSEIRDWSQDHRSDAGDSIAKVAKHFGGNIVLLPLSALYLYGYESDDLRARRTALLGLESFIETTFITASLKYMGQRSRPYTGDPYDTWDGIGLSGDNDYLSFPSTHAARAFSIATIIAEEYKDRPFVPILSYSLATLTALSRINDDEHWASDVFVGSAIGYFTAKAILARHPVDGESWTVLPTTDGKSIGLGVRYQF
ncbi:MAG TPA: phosphatase PAP2 family protein [Bacillota bacterium]|nr:phosphatase PAP2 family protein [Bacillota bacterium]